MNDEMFVLIEASKLSMDDEFMQYQPKDYCEKRFKALLEEVIKKGISDFWRPRMDPSFDKKGNICFKSGMSPAVGKSCNWWRDNAKKFNPGRKSRLGTKSQYIAFLGVLIKALVAQNWTVEEAWDAVCNDSKKLVHYLHYRKILVDEEGGSGYWLAGGYYYGDNNLSPLTAFGYVEYCDCNLFFSVGWIVLEC